MSGERQHVRIGTCENCLETKEVRPIEAYDSLGSGQSRGFYWICFDCFAERVKFVSRRTKQTHYTSIRKGSDK